MSQFENTQYATVFEERESGNELIRSGEWEGPVEIPEGQRPFPDRKAVYDVVEVVEYDEEKNIFDAVTEQFETQKAYQTKHRGEFIQAFEKFNGNG